MNLSPSRSIWNVRSICTRSEKGVRKVDAPWPSSRRALFCPDPPEKSPLKEQSVYFYLARSMANRQVCFLTNLSNSSIALGPFSGFPEKGPESSRPKTRQPNTAFSGVATDIAPWPSFANTAGRLGCYWSSLVILLKRFGHAPTRPPSLELSNRILSRPVSE